MSDQFKGLSFALLATLGGGLYAIPYRLSLETVTPLTVVCGVFLWALLFSLPGAWLAHGIDRKKNPTRTHEAKGSHFWGNTVNNLEN